MFHINTCGTPSTFFMDVDSVTEFPSVQMSAENYTDDGKAADLPHLRSCTEVWSFFGYVLYQG